ncbi:MAG: hypothetical protein LUC90_01680 [Lachnospiraceae bacterium]|nr:hypothetical protein [Lachnospiraceae bacterium]
MKKNLIRLIAIVLTIAFTGTMFACSTGSGEEQSSSAVSNLDENNSASENSDSEEKGTEKAAVDGEDESGSASGSDVSVVYAGENFTKSILAVGGSSLYVCGIRNDEYFFGYMEQEEDCFEEFTLNVSEGMRAYNMYVDSDDQCHILWFATEMVSLNGQELESVSFEESCITIIDSSGSILKCIDTTEFFQEEQAIPVSFAVDRKGNYWFGEGTRLVSISSEGSLNEKVECTDTVETVGVGASGLVYAVVRQEDGTRYLGNIFDDGTFQEEPSLPDAGSSYSCIAPGADEVDVMVYHLTAGVVAYDRNTTKRMIIEEELPVTGESVIGYGFLADGRLCLMSYDADGNMVFYYMDTHCDSFVTFMR